jgi:hypothetical protein
MDKLQEFKQLIHTCWGARNEGCHAWMPYEGNWITIEPVEADGEDLLEVCLSTEVDMLGYPYGECIRVEGVYEEGLDDEFLNGVYKYITTGEEY